MYSITKASPVLRFIVDYFWELDTAISNRDVTEYLFAYPHSNMVFNINEAYLKDDEKEGRIKVDSHKLIGPRLVPVHYCHYDRNKLFGIKLSMGGLALLTNISIAELVNETPDLRHINPQFYDRMTETSVANYQSFTTAVKLAEEIITANLYLQRYKEVTLVQKMAALVHTKMNYSFHLSDLSYLTGSSTKTIERIFLRTVGITPKAYFNQIRCEAAVKGMLSQSYGWSYYDYGFTDQAHFIKQVRKYSHFSPLQLKKVLRVMGCDTFLV